MQTKAFCTISHFQAAQAAWAVEVDPTKPCFWQRVAAKVTGRSAAECHAKLYEQWPTPEAAPPLHVRRYMQAAAAAPPKMPALSVSAGAVELFMVTTSTFRQRHMKNSIAIAVLNVRSCGPPWDIGAQYTGAMVWHRTKPCTYLHQHTTPKKPIFRHLYYTASGAEGLAFPRSRRLCGLLLQPVALLCGTP